MVTAAVTCIKQTKAEETKGADRTSLANAVKAARCQEASFYKLHRAIAMSCLGFFMS